MKSKERVAIVSFLIPGNHEKTAQAAAKKILEFNKKGNVVVTKNTGSGEYGFLKYPKGYIGKWSSLDEVVEDLYSEDFVEQLGGTKFHVKGSILRTS